ncbi:hypothetical protein C8Q75DRAFT_793569 [Abortiporus biennis]|nr:hypothetical protein C8Q75DRAFT_793569 [Abortiporus biennis]
MGEVDAAFSVLPASLRRRIDHAFDSVCESSSRSTSQPAKKRRKLDNPILSGGGFLLDQSAESSCGGGGFIIDEPQAAGGFIPSNDPSRQTTPDEEEEDTAVYQEEHSLIPLSQIPTALQLLDLQPDDEDVLAVFRNAASGWGDRRRGKPVGESEEEQYVSRKDWRAVCAALLDTGEEDQELEEGGQDQLPEEEGEADEDADIDMNEDRESSASEDEYQDSNPELSEFEDDQDSGDEYQEGGGFVLAKSTSKQKVASKRTRSKKLAESDSENESTKGTPKELSARQKAECRRTFALFFPDVKDEDLDNQRIMIKDITRVAKMLNEKITAQETVEMLEEFSTLPDKSLNLTDFERMMVAARMA